MKFIFKNYNYLILVFNDFCKDVCNYKINFKYFNSKNCYLIKIDMINILLAHVLNNIWNTVI